MPHQAKRRKEAKIGAKQRRGSGSAVRRRPPPTPTPHTLFVLGGPSCRRLLLFVCGEQLVRDCNTLGLKSIREGERAGGTGRFSPSPKKHRHLVGKMDL